MILRFLFYLVVGKVLIFITRLFPLTKSLTKHENIKKLINCDLCFGVWVYSILAYFLNVDITENENIIGFFITGSISSFIVWMFSIGWDATFREYKIE